MLLLLGCAGDFSNSDKAEPPFSDTGAGDDTAATGDTSWNPPPPCQGPATIVPVDVGGSESSPYATRLVADLDGGGSPDLLHETWSGGRGIAFVRGEDIAAGVYTPFSTMSDPAAASPAALGAGVTSDLDGDGLPDLLLYADWSASNTSTLVAVSPLRPTTVLGTFTFTAGGRHSVVFATDDPAPDLDGDGVADIVTVTSDYPDSRVYVFDGALAQSGDHDMNDAWLVVSPSFEWGDRPVVAPDLDGDGVDEVVLPIERADETYALFVLGADAAAGGALVAEDLPQLADIGAKAPAFADIDDDGYPELFVTDDIGEGAVYGFAGSALAPALTAAPLTRDDAFVHFDGGNGYLGTHLSTVTDDACLPALAMSAHFSNTVYVATNATLRAGGGREAASLPSLGGTGDWYGYEMGGGEDLDGDGSLDLVVGGRAGGTFDLYLAPFGD